MYARYSPLGYLLMHLEGTIYHIARPTSRERASASRTQVTFLAGGITAAGEVAPL